MDISQLKFEIGSHTFQYNHLQYIVDVSGDHDVHYKVTKIGDKHNRMFGTCRCAREVEADPLGILKALHEECRAWIDNYVSKHLEIQEAVEVCDTEYGGVAE